ncbi:hypothetical protein RHGRI_011551 [Rhododendron griersonianum]|uniref:DUF8040 domain-containing protein n=1 Tax=Rhododendron griersonianum TaxID=479676 RepID=A0AAV6KN52_9ERIC|nr:hypothetical protein RHGRI_011551 [Rhododendron griersonianum]
MARLTKRERRKKANRKTLVAVLCMMRVVNTVVQLYLLITDLIAERHRQRLRQKPHLRPNPNYYQHQIDALNRLVRQSDTTCHNQLRVNRHTFMTLCHLLTQNGLESSRNVTVVEKVAIFLWIIAYHTKNRRTILQFWRSGETISRHFNSILIAVLRLHNVLWYHPQPIPANEPDARWKWFEVHKWHMVSYSNAPIDYKN